MITLTVNGKKLNYSGDGDMPLLWYLREDANLQGTKFGCGIGECGACTVHIDGSAVRSCGVQMGDLNGVSVTTIEGLATNNELHAVQKAWIEEDVPQCGYCQTGQIMATVDLLKNFPNPTDEEIDNNHTNLCRCGTYDRIRKAIHRAAYLMKSED
ncbi:MAG: (2Fe-2S)-binding protein [Emcibacter sp.]|nr:(2Fe-2S)-binding protein [Emcibacter sp.]